MTVRKSFTPPARGARRTCPGAAPHVSRTGQRRCPAAGARDHHAVANRKVVVAITKGKLDFDPWEQIFYGEFDGRRRKRVLVKIIGEQTGVPPSWTRAFP